MNIKRLFQVLTLTVLGCSIAPADDSKVSISKTSTYEGGSNFAPSGEGVLTKAMTNGPSGKTTVKTVEKNTDFQSNYNSKTTPSCEFRIGPVVNYGNDINIQTGPRGQSFGFDEMDMSDAISMGAKVDFDMTFRNRMHFNTSITWINFDHSGNLRNDITFGTGMKLNRGSRVKVDEDIIILEPRFGFDVLHDETFKVMPYVGLIGGVATGEISARSGSVTREQGKVSTIDHPKVYDRTEFFGTYKIGFETQVRITRDFYLGLDLGGYYMGFLNGATGKGFFGYDIDEQWGLRFGCDTDWVRYDARNVDVDGYVNNFYAQMGVKF